jgi:diguanylate cyclase (GGDEF)-like protein
MDPELSDESARLRLADELERLRRVLRQVPGPATAEQVLALVRLCPGLSQGEWLDLAARHNLTDWIGLPLNGESFPLISHLAQTLSELSHQTLHDPLTSLANRRAFDAALDLEVERCRRTKNPMALILLDLDDFKQVNDAHGHACGDRMLVAFAEVLGECKRRYDLAARVGGEEFALLLPGAGMLKAQAVASRLLGAVREMHVQCLDARLSVTCSAGLACYRGRVPLTPCALYDLADKALYEAKAQGKDRAVAAPIPDLTMVETERTLVLASEKQFLFTGNKEGKPRP